MTLKKTVHLQDDVYQGLRSLWVEGLTVRALVDKACREYLDRRQRQTRTTETRGTAGVEIAREKIEDSKPPAVMAVKAVIGTAPLLPAEDELLCKKCKHPKAKHFVRGCVMGCVCTEARYVPSN